MKRALLLYIYTLAILCTFHLTTATDFPSPTVETTETDETKTESAPSIIANVDYKSTFLGTPFESHYPDDQLVSRCPWDIKVFDNKIFVGCGDYDKNTGPCDILYYDLKENVWVNSGTVDDEAVAKFLVIDDKLTVPGIDPKAGNNFSFGSYYVYDQSGWKTINNIPNAVHMFDIEKFKSETFYAIGNSKITQSPVQKTVDGQNFDDVPFLKNGTPISQNSTDSFSRCYALFTAKDKLYAFCRWSNSGYYGFFEYDGNAFNLILENPALEISPEGINRQSLINEHAVFNNKCYFSLGTLYRTTNFKKLEKIDVPKNAYVQDMLVKENKMYILTSEKLTTPLIPTQTYKNTVWEYSEENGFCEVFCFLHNTTAMSFDISDGSFYIALGNKNSSTAQNGAVYEFNTNQ